MQKENSINTPFLSHLKINKDDCPKFDVEKAKMAKIPYAFGCGSLMYVMVAIRLGIAFVVGAVHKYMLNLGKKHWEVVKLILKYLNDTID